MRIAILGAGAWGTALAISVAEASPGRHQVLLWARDRQQVADLAEHRCNQRYLPGPALPEGLALTADLGLALAHAAGGLVVVATPMSALRAMLRAVAPGQAVLWLCKGLETGTGALGHEIAAEERPDIPSGVLSGPSFALEVARGQPTALVAASADAALVDLAVAAFHGPALRVYRSNDPVGVEVGGAVKNVLAIATGILDGLAGQGGNQPRGMPGLNARAALITRGLAEMTRFGVALGAQPATFMGLSGLGDLVLTATGALSRNRQVGLLLAQGQALPDVLAALGHVSEGVYSAATILARARALPVDMPIAEAVVDVLEGRLLPRDAIVRLMSRDVRTEH